MCGIFALYSDDYTENNFEKLIKCMKLLQHRGKDGYGISYLDFFHDFNIIKEKGMLVDRGEISRVSKSCIGHLRYSTSGRSVNTNEVDPEELQPLCGGDYYIAHNGNIPSIESHDTQFLNEQIMKEESVEKGLLRIINFIPGSYSLVLLTKEAIYAVRDRFGIRPLSVGKDDSNYYVSSETCAFEGIDYIRDVNPGELIKIDKAGIQTIFTYPTTQNSLCSFEILYFMNKNSFINNMMIGNIRKNLGSILGRKEKHISKKQDYTVIGIPETGICSGKGYAEYMELKYDQLITKRKNKHRTFIILDKEERKRACDEKFDYSENLTGKKVVILDDTIVRGNIIKSIIKNLKELGVKEIHIRIPAPPVIDICELGISIRTKEELLMNNKTIEEARIELGVESLEFLTIEELEYFPEKSYNQCFSGYIDPVFKI